LVNQGEQLVLHALAPLGDQLPVLVYQGLEALLGAKDLRKNKLAISTRL
jgi:hypothetical protein